MIANNDLSTYIWCHIDYWVLKLLLNFILNELWLKFDTVWVYSHQYSAFKCKDHYKNNDLYYHRKYYIDKTYVNVDFR